MYKNIGRKIKGFSIFVAWLIVVACCFFAFYRLFSGTIDTKSIVISIAIIVLGSLFALVLSWFLYAFGEIAHNSAKQNENLETLILTLDDLSSKLNSETLKNKTNLKKEEIPLGEFKLPETREELFQSQLKKLKKDYEMSRITYDEYEEGKKLLEEKYR